MRGTGNHVPPTQTQPMPPDNTSRYVLTQVTAWRWRHRGLTDGEWSSGELIHTESAREIAAWYASPGSSYGRAFALFATAGEVADDLIRAIDCEVIHAIGSSRPPLRALRAYVKASNS